MVFRKEIAASRRRQKEKKKRKFVSHFTDKKKREKKNNFCPLQNQKRKDRVKKTHLWMRKNRQWRSAGTGSSPARNEEEKEPHSLSCVATERTGRRKVSAECESSKDGESASNSRGNLQALPGRGSIGSTGSLNRLIRSLAPFFGPPSSLFVCVRLYFPRKYLQCIKKKIFQS